MQRIVKLKPLLSHGIKLKPHPYNHGIPCVRMFSKKAKAPDEYYDESVEDDKEFFDIITSLKKENGSGSLRTLTTLNVCASNAFEMSSVYMLVLFDVSCILVETC